MRKNARDKFYLYCGNCTGDGLQDYILEHATLFGPDGEPVQPTPINAPEPASEELPPPAEPVPEPEPEPDPQIDIEDKDDFDSWMQDL